MTIATSEGNMISPSMPMGLVMRVLCALASVNTDRLMQCPKDDWLATSRTGLAILFSFLFTTFTVTGALWIALGNSISLFALAPLAMLMAAMVICMDHAIIQSHWFQTGLRQVNRTNIGWKLNRSGGFFGAFAAGTVRFLLSMSVAFTIAGFADLQIFANDILAVLSKDNRQINQAIYARATQTVQQSIDRAALEVARLDPQIATLRAAEAAQIQTIDRVQKQSLERVKGLQAELSGLQVRHDAAAIDTVAELYGRRYNPGNSGLAGKGAGYDSADALKNLFRQRMTAIEAELASLTLSNSKAAQNAKQALDTIQKDISDRESIRGRLLTTREEMTGQLPKAIMAAATTDPEYVQMRDGLAIRLGAMMRLAQEPGVFWQVAGLKALIMLVEMGGLITALLLITPSLYTLRTVLEFETAAARLSAEAQAEISIHMAVSKSLTDEAEAQREQSERNTLRRRNTAHARQGFNDAIKDIYAEASQRNVEK